jgi:hypothetical protein
MTTLIQAVRKAFRQLRKTLASDQRPTYESMAIQTFRTSPTSTTKREPLDTPSCLPTTKPQATLQSRAWPASEFIGTRAPKGLH